MTLKGEINEVLELLRCDIVNVCFDNTIDKTEELRRQREFISEKTLSILSAIKGRVPKKYNKDTKLFPFRKEFVEYEKGFNACCNQFLNEVEG